MVASDGYLPWVSKVYGRFKAILTWAYWSFQHSLSSLQEGQSCPKAACQASIQCLSYGCNPCPALNSPLKAKMKEMTASKNRSINCSCKSFIEKHYTTQYKPALKLSLILLLYSILFYLSTYLSISLSNSLFFFLSSSHPFSPILMDEKVPSLQKGGPLGITRLQFYLHLVCREMAQGKVSRGILNPKGNKLKGQPNIMADTRHCICMPTLNIPHSVPPCSLLPFPLQQRKAPLFVPVLTGGA